MLMSIRLYLLKWQLLGNLKIMPAICIASLSEDTVLENYVNGHCFENVQFRIVNKTV